MIDIKKPAADVVTTNTPRLKKDGTPDRRNGNPGNAGNKHATGRKRIEGQELRKPMGYYASPQEAACIKAFIKILHKNPTIIDNVLSELGTPPPEGTPAPPRKRKRYTCTLLQAEKPIVKNVIAIIKDRLSASKAIIDNYII